MITPNIAWRRSPEVLLARPLLAAVGLGLAAGVLAAAPAAFDVSYGVLLFSAAPFLAYAILRWPKIGLYLLLITVPLMPFVPDEIGPVEVLFAILFALTVAGWLPRMFALGGIGLRSAVTWWLTVILLLMLTSILQAMDNEVPLALWLRGMIPFANLVVYYIALKEFRSERDLGFLEAALYVSAVLYSVQIYWPAASHAGSLASVRGLLRLRAEMPGNAYQPLVLAAIGFLLGGYAWRELREAPWRILLLAWLTGALLLTFLRSAVLIVGFLLMLKGLSFVRKAPLRRRLLVAATTLVASAVAVIVLLTVQSVWNYASAIYLAYALRIGSESFESSGRVEEWASVLRHWVRQPILGHGLGFKHTFFKTVLGAYFSAGYTHNIFSYFLLTLGITGAGIVACLAITVFRRSRALRRASNARLAQLGRGLSWSLLSMFLYVQFQSIFRSISFSVYVGLALAAMERLAALVAAGEGERVSREPEGAPQPPARA